LKEKVYRNIPHTLEASEVKIWNVILDILECEHRIYVGIKCAHMLEETTFSRHYNIRYIMWFY